MKKILKTLARTIKRVLDRVFGTVVEEIRWQGRDDAWAERSLSHASLEHPHRAFLLGHIARWEPFNTLLEVGCASGPNLFLLAKRYPDKAFFGAEINARGVRRGNAYARESGANVELWVARADDLSMFPDKSMDLVCSDSALICVGPDKIGKAVREMVRVARRGLILNEWHQEEREVVYCDHWIYNWRSLLKEFIPSERLRLTPIPENVWGGNWARYGNIIEVGLTENLPRAERADTIL